MAKNYDMYRKKSKRYYSKFCCGDAKAPSGSIVPSDESGILSCTLLRAACHLNGDCRLFQIRGGGLESFV